MDDSNSKNTFYIKTCLTGSTGLNNKLKFQFMNFTQFICFFSSSAHASYLKSLSYVDIINL